MACDEHGDVFPTMRAEPFQAVSGGIVDTDKTARAACEQYGLLESQNLVYDTEKPAMQYMVPPKGKSVRSLFEEAAHRTAPCINPPHVWDRKSERNALLGMQERSEPKQVLNTRSVAYTAYKRNCAAFIRSVFTSERIDKAWEHCCKSLT